jgi:hypothetical protein
MREWYDPLLEEPEDDVKRWGLAQKCYLCSRYVLPMSPGRTAESWRARGDSNSRPSA